MGFVLNSFDNEYDLVFYRLYKLYKVTSNYFIGLHLSVIKNPPV